MAGMLDRSIKARSGGSALRAIDRGAQCFGQGNWPWGWPASGERAEPGKVAVAVPSSTQNFAVAHPDVTS
jgi:hypothetical protein